MDPLAAVRDPARGRRNLAALARHLGPDRSTALTVALARLLPFTAAPDLALNSLDRLLAQPTAAAHLPHLLADDARGLEAVLHLLATSQFFADTFVTPTPRRFDRGAQRGRRVGQPGPPTNLTAELKAVTWTPATDDAGTLLKPFRRFRQLHMLRIGANDILRDRRAGGSDPRVGPRGRFVQRRRSRSPRP